MCRYNIGNRLQQGYTGLQAGLERHRVDRKQIKNETKLCLRRHRNSRNVDA